MNQQDRAILLLHCGTDNLLLGDTVSALFSFKSDPAPLLRHAVGDNNGTEPDDHRGEGEFPQGGSTTRLTVGGQKESPGTLIHSRGKDTRTVPTTVMVGTGDLNRG